MSAAAADASFLDLLYAAPLEPAHWVTVLERLADRVGGGPATLVRQNLDDQTGAVMIARLDPSVALGFHDRFAIGNPVHGVDDVEAFIRSWAPTVFTYEDVIAREDYVRTAFYNELNRPIGADWALAVRLTMEGRERSQIQIGRTAAMGSYSGGELDGLRRLQPHLIRAYKLSDRLAVARLPAEGARLALELSADAVMLLDETGRIVQLNRAGERLLAGGHGLSSSGGRLTATGARPASMLAALIARAGSRDPQTRSGDSLALPSPGRRFPLSLTAVPVRPEAPTPFSAAPAVLVCVTDPGGEAKPSADRLREAYGLTDAECRVALALFEGFSPREMAARFDVSANTVRVQLGGVYGKTGTHRQAELVRLMSAVRSEASAGAGAPHRTWGPA